MKITATKIKKELVKNYGWGVLSLNSEANKALADALIKDTIKVIDGILKKHKGFSIR